MITPTTAPYIAAGGAILATLGPIITGFVMARLIRRETRLNETVREACEAASDRLDRAYVREGLTKLYEKEHA